MPTAAATRRVGVGRLHVQVAGAADDRPVREADHGHRQPPAGGPLREGGGEPLVEPRPAGVEGHVLPDAVVEHKKTGFATANAREFGLKVVANRTYLFRKNFRPNVWKWLQFVLLFVVLLAHRLVNREWAGARGLVQGMHEAWLRRP